MLINQYGHARHITSPARRSGSSLGPGKTFRPVGDGRDARGHVPHRPGLDSEKHRASPGPTREHTGLRVSPFAGKPNADTFACVTSTIETASPQARWPR
jgi:hypothetical protein